MWWFNKKDKEKTYQISKEDIEKLIDKLDALQIASYVPHSVGHDYWNYSVKVSGTCAYIKGMIKRITDFEY